MKKSMTNCIFVTLNRMKTALSVSVRMDKESPLVLSSDLDGKF